MIKISQLLNYIVFFSTSLAIAGVFYEGMALQWYNIVGVFIAVMDFFFIVSTAVNLVVYRKTKWKYLNIFSIIIIIIVAVMKIFSVSYPIWSLVFWYFYIWFTYGIQISGKGMNN